MEYRTCARLSKLMERGVYGLKARGVDPKLVEDVSGKSRRDCGLPRQWAQVGATTHK